jgi:hypothetical protein
MITRVMSGVSRSLIGFKRPVSHAPSAQGHTSMGWSIGLYPSYDAANSGAPNNFLRSREGARNSSACETFS